MTEAEFNELIDHTFEALETSLDQVEGDLDYEMSGGVLTVEFENDTMLVFSRQSPTLQLWLAARSGGFHFDYDTEGECWRLQGKDDELYSCLSRYCSEQAGETVTLE